MSDATDPPSRAAVESALAALGRSEDTTLELAEAALLLAALDRPRVGLGRYRAHLAELADRVARQPAAGLAAAADALERVIRDELGYDGDRLTYDDPQNANLMRVIDRRRGLPVTLALLYLHAARAQGWQAEALRFPGHLLLRLEVAGERAILDPFHGGGVLGAEALRALAKAIGGAEAELTPEHTEAASDREVLLRLQNNIKTRRLQNRQPEAALVALDSMLLLAPADWSLWAEAAELQARLENLQAAAQALRQVIALAPSALRRGEAERQLRALTQRLN